MAHEEEFVEVCQYHSGIAEQIKSMHDDIKIIQDKMDRPPVWLTFVFSGMTFLLGATCSWILHLHSLLK